MMVTHTGAPPLRVAIVTIVIVVGIGAVRAFAQAPEEITCPKYSPGSPYQTIIVHLVGEDCRIDPYGGSLKLPRLEGQRGRRISWDVCNKCGAPVDVKLFGSTPTSLYDMFDYPAPPIDFDGTWLAKAVDQGLNPVFKGDVKKNGNIFKKNLYSVSVKFSTEDEGGWDPIDPELQIDENLVIYERIWLGLAALLGLVFGFGGGWWFARR